jgi:hypothetical protein
MSLALAVGLLGSTSALAQNASAQGKAPEKAQREVVVEEREVLIAGQDAPPEGAVRIRTPHGHPAGLPPPDTMIFLSSEMSFDGKVVKGAPYSAEAVTETTQTLADGNRIVHKNTANIYRDGEGRTRREHTLSAVGPFAVGGEPPQTYFINDPVAGVNYILDPRTRTARKLPMPDISFIRDALGADVRKEAKDAKGVKEVQEVTKLKLKDKVVEFNVELPPPPPGMHHGTMMRHHSRIHENARKESLGTRTVNGVQAEGTRSTITIPAGEVGNELPINIVFERWYSPELQLVVMTKHSDPRFGETVYSLNNINRSEPARTLFEVPADYTIKEGPAIRTFMRRKRGDREEK